MKITHAIIKDGIIKGIPEGTKVPEKRHNTGLSVCACQECLDYMYALAASVEWEDQETALKSITCHCDKDGECSWKQCPNGGDRMALEPGRIECPLAQWDDYEAEKPDFEEDGIYPLEGVNVEKVWQAKMIGYPKSGWIEWVKERDLDPKIWEYRQVLRLIPQPNSDRFDKVLAGVSDEIKAEVDAQFKAIDSRVDGTEVSEPTSDELQIPKR